MPESARPEQIEAAAGRLAHILDEARDEHNAEQRRSAR